jgi:hypothetical protein
MKARVFEIIHVIGLAVLLAASTVSASSGFEPDTLWISSQSGGIFKVTLVRDAAGLPQTATASLFAQTPPGLSPGLAFFDGALYYASAEEGLIYRFQSDGTRTPHATGFGAYYHGITSILFDREGGLLVTETTLDDSGTVWEIPTGGGSAPFDVFLSSSDIGGPISLSRNWQTGELFVSDWHHGGIGGVIGRDLSGVVRTVAHGFWSPMDAQPDCEGTLYVGESSGRVLTVDSAGVVSECLWVQLAQGIAVDTYGYMYVVSLNGDLVWFDSSCRPTGGHLLLNLGTNLNRIVWYGGGTGPNTGVPLCAQTLSCTGFQPPMASGPVTVRGNRALPLKAQLFNADGAQMTDLELTAPPVLQVMFESAAGGTPVDVTGDALPAGHGTDGNEFEYNLPDQLWQYNLKTKDYTAAGTYTITMVSGDDSEYIIDPTCEATFERQE